jgi:hypothetical protein
MATSTTPARSQGRSALVVGFVLVLIGGGALVSELLPDYDRYVPMLIGLGLLAVFFVTRAYIALVFGAILTGVGAGLLVSEAFFHSADADGPGATLGLGFGFLGIWTVSLLMRLKEHHFWPLIPGGILLLVGTGLVLDLFEGDLSRWVVPAIVVIIGVVVMLVGFLRMPREGGTSAT